MDMSSGGGKTVTTSEDLKQGLVAYYPLQGDANDYSGHNHNGTPNPNVRYSPGRMGLAADFTKDANIQIPWTSRYENHYTLSLWVNIHAYSSMDSKDAQWGRLLGQLRVYHSNGKLAFEFYYDPAEGAANQFIELDSKSNLSRKAWHHVLVTYNHDTRKLAFYIDGTLDVEHDLSSRDRANRPSSVPYLALHWRFSRHKQLSL